VDGTTTRPRSAGSRTVCTGPSSTYVPCFDCRVLDAYVMTHSHEEVDVQY
jgi:hypothetical protein